MNIGALDKLVTLQSPGSVPDNEGGYTEAWTNLSPGTVWAAIQPATARDLERRVASTVQASASHLVTIRFHSGVTTKTRILFGTRIFNVTGITNPDEKNEALILACEEVVA